MLAELSRLGQEFGQHMHQVVADLLLATVPPASLSAMEQGVREAMLRLGNFLLSNWLAVQMAPYPESSIPCRCGGTAQ